MPTLPDYFQTQLLILSAITLWDFQSSRSSHTLIRLRVGTCSRHEFPSPGYSRRAVSLASIGSSASAPSSHSTSSGRGWKSRYGRTSGRSFREARRNSPRAKKRERRTSDPRLILLSLAIQSGLRPVNGDAATDNGFSEIKRLYDQI